MSSGHPTEHGARLFSALRRARLRAVWKLLPCGYVVGRRTFGGVINEVEPWLRCHCGQPAPFRGDDDPWEHRLDGYCYECALARCDAYPDECPVKYPPTPLEIDRGS